MDGPLYTATRIPTASLLMDSVTQIAADLTTTAGGGSTVLGLIKRHTPSKQLVKGEMRLDETIDTLEYMLEKRSSSAVRSQVRGFRITHDR